MGKEDKQPQYLPLIVKAKLHTGGRDYEKIKEELLQRERITIPPTVGTAAGRSGRKDKQHKSAPAAPDKRKQPGYWLGKTENEGGQEQ